MGLPDSYYADLLKQKQDQALKTAQTPTQPDQQPAAPDNRPVLQKAEDSLIKPLDRVSTPESAKPDLTPEQTAANMAKTGTGHFIGREIGSTLGLQFPDEQTWDGMSVGNKAAYTTFEGIKAFGKMLVRLPRQVIKAPIKVGYNIVKPWSDMVQGKPATYAAEADSKGLNIPWVGNVSSYFKDFSDARKSGVGPAAATLLTSSNALGDVTIAGSLAEAVTTAFQPRAKLAPGEQAVNTEPIRQVMGDSQGKPKLMTKPEGSPNEYYSLPKTVAKKYGGGSNDTFLKVSPANVVGDSHSVEVSVVKLRNGAIKQGVDYVKGKLGLGDQITTGDFGPEVKMDGQIVKTDGKIPYGTQPPAPIPGAPAVDGVKPQASLPAGTPAAEPRPVDSILPKPLKGMEDKPITEDQLGHLQKLAEFNKIDPNIVQKVIENVTGKSTVGSLTQGEYVKASQTLGVMGNTGQYLGDTNPFINPASQWLSPTRKFFRSVEETHGMPIYSGAYVPMEDASQLQRVFVDKHDAILNDIYAGRTAEGKTTFAHDYNGTGYGEERRLIKAYLEGNTDAVLANDTLDPKVKTDLVQVADGLKKFYAETGPALGIDPEFFIKNYQPHIQNIGGVYQLYKEGSEIPKALDFFAEHKRNGSLTSQIDDSLALAQIYTRAGAKKMFLNPVLDKVMGMYDGLPKNLQGSVKAYIQEKMGYSGRLEQSLNDMVPAINRKLGMDLPPDLARKTSQVIMDTTYSGALGLRPDAVLREALISPTMVYARLGPEFYPQAVAKSLTPAGIEEFNQSGLKVAMGVPYGEELAKDTTLTGQAGNAFRKFTQGIMKPYEIGDAFTRRTAYFQFQMQWENALSKYNAGKLDYAGFEKAAGMDKFSPVDQNIIRQKLVAGDQAGAFNHGVRDIIDDIKAPFRSGAGARATFDLGGKLSVGQFTSYSLNYAHTLGSWVRTGQWGNLIRWYASATAAKRTMEDTFGLDINKWVGLHPLDISAPPFVKVGNELLNLLNAHFSNNQQAINQAQDNILKEGKALGFPGVQGTRVQNFYKDMSLSAKDKLAPGVYGIYDAHGKLTDTTDFANLMWGTLFGLPTKTNSDRQNLQTDMTNAKYDYTQAKTSVLELYRQGKFDQANQIIQEKGIQLTPGDFDAYYIPLDQRTYQALPASLKPQFAPKVYAPNK